MSASIDDMEAYTKLTDGVVEMILNSPDQKLDESKNILNRVIKRDLYKFAGELQLTVDTKKSGPSQKKVSILKTLSKFFQYKITKYSRTSHSFVWLQLKQWTREIHEYCDEKLQEDLAVKDLKLLVSNAALILAIT